MGHGTRAAQCAHDACGEREEVECDRDQARADLEHAGHIHAALRAEVTDLKGQLRRATESAEYEVERTRRWTPPGRLPVRICSGSCGARQSRPQCSSWLVFEIFELTFGYLAVVRHHFDGEHISHLLAGAVQIPRQSVALRSIERIRESV